MSDENFISRWSRRKKEAGGGRREAEGEKPETRDERRGVVAPISPAPLPLPAEPAALPPVESLTPESDFSPFMREGVDPDMRRVAVKKLFEDPRFNVMDGLDVYIDDYSKPDPLPEGWLEKLNQTARLGIFQPAPAEAEEPAPPEASSESPQLPAEKQGDALAPPAVTSTEAIDVSPVGQSAPDKA